MKAHDRRGGWPLPIGPHPESPCDTPTAQGAMGSEGPLEAPWTCRVSDQDATGHYAQPCGTFACVWTGDARAHAECSLVRTAITGSECGLRCRGSPTS